MSIDSKNFVTVVSGLPRSGTSMMMRMLDHGGLMALTDNIRQSDIHNPYGYYEFERVKKLPKDKDWIDEACGKALKVIYVLLYELPSSHHYKVVFMTRNVEEVINSQEAMLLRQNAPNDLKVRQRLTASFQKQLDQLTDWIALQDNMSVIFVDYHDVLYCSKEAATRVNEFLDVNLDVDAMTAVINPELHRNKVT